jgi:hypothetical protein
MGGNWKSGSGKNSPDPQNCKYLIPTQLASILSLIISWYYLLNKWWNNSLELWESAGQEEKQQSNRSGKSKRHQSLKQIVRLVTSYHARKW